MNFFTTLVATIAVASAIVYNADTIDGTSEDGTQSTPHVASNEVPPPAPPPDEISFSD